MTKTHTLIAIVFGIATLATPPGARGQGSVLGRTKSADTLSPVSRFDSEPCPFAPAEDQIEGTTLTCGVVLVPEDRSRPDGNWIRLAVAIFRGPTTATRPPLIFLGGGPGTYVLEEFGPRVTGSLATDLTAGRDFVMFDQRGVGFSQPSLQCPELRELKYRTIGLHRSRAREIEDRVDAAFACRDRLVASGIDLSAYHTAASAADVNDIRQTLHYGAMDVWGLSYGTRLALAVARDFPQGVHSLVLDSALPQLVNQLIDRASNAERAFQVLFDGCAADAACAAAYPDLEAVFYDLVAQLNSIPATYFAQHPQTGVVYDVILTGDGLIRMLVDALVPSYLTPFIPFAAASVRNGDFTVMSQATSLLTFDDRHSEGTFYSVNCADFASGTSIQEVTAARRNVHPALAQALGEEARLRICEGWGAARSMPTTHTPVVSSVPTLIFAGEYDPLTPPHYAQIASRTLRNSLWFEFPAMSHNVQRSSSCAHAMMIAFLADPERTPDASCIDDMRPPVWFIPDNSLR